MDVPDQDSPQHILNCLNDYCIQLIISQLKTRMDFLNVANTCHRFRMNAKSYFGQGVYMEYDELSLEDENRFSNIFGNGKKYLKWKKINNMERLLKIQLDLSQLPEINFTLVFSEALENLRTLLEEDEE